MALSEKGQAAVWYAEEMGWSVFPLHSITPSGVCSCGHQCKSPGKHPMTGDGFKSATTEIETIEQWWGEHPDANIGLPTGRRNNIVVVDLDEAKGGSEADLTAMGKDLLQTMTARTGGGRHFYYIYPVGVDIRNSTGKLGFAIDVRGEGGYVVAPPSNHISGRTYQWIKDQFFREFPTEFHHKLTDHNPLIEAKETGLVIYEKERFQIPTVIPDGQRNHTLTRVAGALRNLGLTVPEMTAALERVNERVCQPPVDSQEIVRICQSVGRYESDNLTEVVGEADDAEASALNTLQWYFLDEIEKLEVEEREVLGFHIGARDVAMFSGATNAGKSTLLRNLALCLAAGRPYEPFIPGQRPVKTLYLDFETDVADLQPDFRRMRSSLDERHSALAGRNLILLPKGLIQGELFQLNRHWDIVSGLIKHEGIEMIIVDNVSSAFDLNDENSNAEVTKKVIKPLLKLAHSSNCATVFVHHFGKGSDGDSVYAGRGASAFMSLSKTVYNLEGDVSKGETVRVVCAKRKSDNGQRYIEPLKLDHETRWFQPDVRTVTEYPKKHDPHVQVMDFVDFYRYPRTVSTGTVCEHFPDFSVRKVKGILKDLVSEQMILKVEHGKFCSARSEEDEKE